MIRNASTAGDDAIYGFDRDDVLEGGLGHDLMTGRAGADQYIYARGDGLDVIEDGMVGWISAAPSNISSGGGCRAINIGY